jgi:hypothetical protein
MCQEMWSNGRAGSNDRIWSKVLLRFDLIQLISIAVAFVILNASAGLMLRRLCDNGQDSQTTTYGTGVRRLSRK